MKMRWPDVRALGILAALVAAVAAFGSWFSTEATRTWYPLILKPSWTPPAWVFGPVWTVLYAMIALAGWVFYRRAGWADRSAWGWYAVQLLLNGLWSPIFFGFKNPGAALVDLGALWVAIVFTMVSFSRHSRLAAGLLVPYALWVTFAGALNAAIWVLNP